MEVKIVVDETKFKDVLENELAAFSKEELHEIIRDCIIDTFKNPEFIKSIFIRKDHWGNPSPSELLKNAVKNIDLSPAFKEVTDIMVEYLKNNYKKVLENVMIKYMIDGIARNDYFNNAIKDTVDKIFLERNR